MAKKDVNRKQQLFAIAISVLAVVVFAGWYYFDQVYFKSENVFWSAINQNLQTSSVLKSISQSNDSQSLNQLTRMQFKGQLATEITVTIETKTETTSSRIVSKTIGTATHDYLKYDEITSPTRQVPGVTGKWASSNIENGDQIDVLQSELLASPIFFGYFNHFQRNDLINKMKTDNVFEIDFNETNKNSSFNGKKVYIFSGHINLSTYTDVFRQYLILLGQNQLADQIASPGANSLLSFKLYVDPISRQTKQLMLGDESRAEQYLNYDNNQPIDIPTNVSIKIEDLQNILLTQ